MVSTSILELGIGLAFHRFLPTFFLCSPLLVIVFGESVFVMSMVFE